MKKHVFFNGDYVGTIDFDESLSIPVHSVKKNIEAFYKMDLNKIPENLFDIFLKDNMSDDVYCFQLVAEIESKLTKDNLETLERLAHKYRSKTLDHLITFLVLYDEITFKYLD